MAYFASICSSRDASRSRRTEFQRAESVDRRAAPANSCISRATAFTRRRDRTLKTADRQTASYAVRPFFGKVNRQIEQLELRLGELEASRTTEADPREAPTTERTVTRPVRRPLPGHLPREVQTYLPQHEACPDCGGELRHFGEDVAEILECVPERIKVIRQVRPKLACARCDRIVQAPAPSRPIERGVAGPGLLAHVLVSKYSDHLPLYRQAEIYAHEGVESDRPTLAE